MGRGRFGLDLGRTGFLRFHFFGHILEPALAILDDGRRHLGVPMHGAAHTSCAPGAARGAEEATPCCTPICFAVHLGPSHEYYKAATPAPRSTGGAARACLSRSAQFTLQHKAHTSCVLPRPSPAFAATALVADLHLGRPQPAMFAESAHHMPHASARHHPVNFHMFPRPCRYETVRTTRPLRVDPGAGLL